MSNVMYVYLVPRVAAEIDEEIKAGLAGEPVDEMTLQVGEEKLGIKLIWISPRSGNLIEGLQQYLPKIWEDTCGYLVTPEQMREVLDVSKKAADRDKAEFRDPEEFHAYLMKEFQIMDDIITTTDFNTHALFAHEC